jgi:YVTN family beta-propeller protein
MFVIRISYAIVLALVATLMIPSQSVFSPSSPVTPISAISSIPHAYGISSFLNNTYNGGSFDGAINNTGQNIQKTPGQNFKSLSAQFIIAADALNNTIPVLPQPLGIAYDSANGYIYVANNGSNTVSVIDGNPSDTSTYNTVIASPGVGRAPYDIAFDSDNGYLYVTTANGVYVINGANNQVVGAPITVAYHPYDVAFDSANREIYVSCEGLSSSGGAGIVSVISDSTNQVITAIQVGSYPSEIAFDSANGYIYVADGGGTVSVINGATNALATGFTNPINLETNVDGVAFDSANDEIYVTDYFLGAVSVINGTTNHVVGSISVNANNPARDVFDSASGIIYVVNYGSNSVSVIVPTPTVPTGVTITGVTFNSVSVSWNSVPGATNYVVYVSTSPSGPFSTRNVAAPTTSYTISPAGIIP